MLEAKLYTFEVFCPEQRTNVHVPVYDCVRWLWDEKKIQFYCPACKNNHIIQNLRQA